MRIHFIPLVFLCLFLPATSVAQLPLESLKERVKVTADMRIRAEQDFAYLNSSGTEVDDRFRFRLRARMGSIFQINEKHSFGFRLRAGNIKDQQSPHASFGSSGEEAPLSLGFDQAYIKGDYGKFWWWAGKNDFPFYQVTNELYWDNDVTPEGFAFGGKLKAGEKVVLKPTAGLFIIQNANAGFLKNDASLAALQFAVSGNTGKVGVHAAAGFFNFRNMPNLPDAVQTDTLAYSHVVANLKLTLNAKIPVSIGGDVMLNTEDYSSDTLITATGLQNDQTGFVVFAEVGSLKEKGSFLIGMYYASIEKYSAVDYLAQDDWVRWGFPGGASGTRSSNFSGQEFRLAYAFAPRFNIVGRLYLVKGIHPATPTSTIEEANRFRIDLNIGI